MKMYCMPMTQNIDYHEFQNLIKFSEVTNNMSKIFFFNRLMAHLGNFVVVWVYYHGYHRNVNRI